MIIPLVIAIILIVVLAISCFALNEKIEVMQQKYFDELDKNEELECRIIDFQTPKEVIDCTPIIDFEEMCVVSIERDPNSGKVVLGYVVDDREKLAEWALYGLDNAKYRELLADYRLYLASKD